MKGELRKVLITGGVGFIGFSLAKRIIAEFPSAKIIIIDNLNDYYSVQLKKDRLQELQKYDNILFIQGDVADFDFLTKISHSHPDIEIIFHLAAQAGVRSSVTEPFRYVASNLVGQVAILELAKLLPDLKKFIYASSSSVYGMHDKNSFKEDLQLGKPLSLYSATKQFSELACDVYSRLFSIPMIGFRFFTAYGPWGRPDMAIYKITNLIKKNEIVELVSNGKVKRDFTYIDDVINGIILSINYQPLKDQSGFQNEVFNLGSGQNADIQYLTKIIADFLGKKPNIKYIESNPMDMDSTLSDISKAKELLGYNPKTDLRDGVKLFIDWHNLYHN